MKSKGLLFSILLTFVLTFVATGIVTLLWNLLIEKTGAVVDWKTSFVFAIIIGLVIPITRHTGKTE
jgi:hypothetical protein